MVHKKRMTFYKQLDPMSEYRTQFAFKGKREHIGKLNITHLTYPNQHTDNEISHGSIDHVIEPDIAKITFNLEIESIDKKRSTVNNVGKTLAKKKVFMLSSKEIDTINNSNI